MIFLLYMQAFLFGKEYIFLNANSVILTKNFPNDIKTFEMCQINQFIPLYNKSIPIAFSIYSPHRFPYCQLSKAQWYSKLKNAGFSSGKTHSAHSSVSLWNVCVGNYDSHKHKYISSSNSMSWCIGSDVCRFTGEHYVTDVRASKAALTFN